MHCNQLLKSELPTRRLRICKRINYAVVKYSAQNLFFTNDIEPKVLRGFHCRSSTIGCRR